jgi:hypothetical protein
LAALLDAIGTLVTFGLITRTTGPSNEQVFQLTESGRSTSRMMGLS